MKPLLLSTTIRRGQAGIARQISRGICSSTPCGRELYAKFKRPRVPPTQPISSKPFGPTETPGGRLGDAPVSASSSSLSTETHTPIVKVTATPPQPAAAEAASGLVPSSSATVVVAGIHIPPKPIPPGPEDCCMSGCVNCVYTIYADDIEERIAAIADARAELKARGTPQAEWPEIVQEASGEAEGEEVVQPQIEDPTLSAFMALENKLKKKTAVPPKPKIPPGIDPTMAAFMALEQKLKSKQQAAP